MWLARWTTIALLIFLFIFVEENLVDGSALGLEADFLGSPGLYAERRSTHGRPKHYRRRKKKKGEEEKRVTDSL